VSLGNACPSCSSAPVSASGMALLSFRFVPAKPGQACWQNCPWPAEAITERRSVDRSIWNGMEPSARSSLCSYAYAYAMTKSSVWKAAIKPKHGTRLLHALQYAASVAEWEGLRRPRQLNQLGLAGDLVLLVIWLSRFSSINEMIHPVALLDMMERSGVKDTSIYFRIGMSFSS
jgi:hypothetical protein